MRLLLVTPNAELASLVKKSLSRFHYEWEEVDNGLDAFQKVVTQRFDLILLDYELDRISAVEILRRFGALQNFKAPPIIIFTRSEEERLTIEHEHFPRTQIISRPMAIRTFVETVRYLLHQGTRVVCLGGGTGLFTLLSGLKTISGIQLSSIVSMSDDGGSTGILRDLFGVLPPGDIRRSLVALSTAPDLLNELIQYRFKRGGEFTDHNLGNLLLTALAEMRGSMTEAIKSLAEILNIQGQVIPVTETMNTLRAKLENGAVIEGEHRIDLFEGHDPNLNIIELSQDPPVSATADALEAIYNAQLILLGPGDLFTSIISNLIVGGIAEAICASHAKKIYICNIMTKPGETTSYTVEDHVREIVKYLGKDVLDVVLASSTEFHQDALDHYLEKKQEPVRASSLEAIKKQTKAKLILADVASEHELVRHDSLKLAAFLRSMIDENRPAK